MARRYKRDSRGRFASGNRGGGGGSRAGAGRKKGSINKPKLVQEKVTTRSKISSKVDNTKQKFRNAELGTKLRKAARKKENWEMAASVVTLAAYGAVYGHAAVTYGGAARTATRNRNARAANVRGVTFQNTAKLKPARKIRGAYRI